MATITLSLPSEITLTTRERDENAPRVTIYPEQIAPDVAAEIFTYGLQVIINRMANTPENVTKAQEAAVRLNNGEHWRTRAVGETQDAVSKEAEAIALRAVKAVKPAGTKMADWLANPAVKAKIAEIAARDSTRQDAAKLVEQRKSAIRTTEVDLSDL